MKYLVTHPSKFCEGQIQLDGSKSISNRLLVIRHLCKKNFELNGLSTSDDTQVLQKAISFKSTEIDIHHAGTCMRFLTALLSITNGEWLLTGSQRMQQRPIGLLVEALQKLGAQISYSNKQGYPPLKITGHALNGGNITIKGNISSQFITALLLVAPVLKNGLILNIDGNLVSRPYVQMTLDIMAAFGIKYQWNGNQINIQNQAYKAHDFEVEADWSGASYFFGIASLAKQANIQLKGLQAKSYQGDAACTQIGALLNITSNWNNGLLNLTQKTASQQFNFNFIECPDLAQTFVVNCAALGIDGHFSGLQTLAIKETDRTAALATELAKFNIRFYEQNGTWILNTNQANFNRTIAIDTYKDHRMAMAFAPLALVCPNGIIINEPKVVSKSYPAFWADLEKLGFNIKDLS